MKQKSGMAVHCRLALSYAFITARPRGQRGFTLIELLVVIVVVTILASIAFPTYEELVKRARRSEARAALNNAAALQEKFYMDNKSYASSMGGIRMKATTENGYYVLSVPSSNTFGYTIRATARLAQAKDSTCATMQVTQLGGKTPVECW